MKLRYLIAFLTPLIIALNSSALASIKAEYGVALAMAEKADLGRFLKNHLP